MDKLTFDLSLVLLIHGEDLILPSTVPAGGALQSLLEPGVPAAQTGHVLALGNIQIVILIADAAPDCIIVLNHSRRFVDSCFTWWLSPICRLRAWFVLRGLYSRDWCSCCHFRPKYTLNKWTVSYLISIADFSTEGLRATLGTEWSGYMFSYLLVNLVRAW